MHHLRKRRSIRHFGDTPVERGLIERLVEAASWAPTAGNRQDWLFSVVESSETKEAMAAAVRRRWQEIITANQELGFIQEVAGYAASFADFDRAPAVIVVSAARVNLVQRRLLDEAAGATAGSFASAAMAAQNLMLAAHALGLGTCCMTGALAASEDLARILGLGRRRELVCLIAVGYPVAQPAAPERKPYHEIMRFC
jgi:nitroreductase